MPKKQRKTIRRYYLLSKYKPFFRNNLQNEINQYRQLSTYKKVSAHIRTPFSLFETDNPKE